MSDTSNKPKTILEAIKSHIKTKVEPTEFLYDQLLTLLYKEVTGIEVPQTFDPKKIKSILEGKVGKIIEDLDEKGQVKICDELKNDNKRKDEIAKAEWLSKWSTQFVNDCINATNKIKPGKDTPKDEKETQETLEKIAKAVAKVYDDYTDVPWYSVISPYWRNFKKYFGEGDKKAIEKTKNKIEKNGK